MRHRTGRTRDFDTFLGQLVACAIDVFDADGEMTEAGADLPEALAALIGVETAKWAKAIHDAKIEPQ